MTSPPAVQLSKKHYNLWDFIAINMEYSLVAAAKARVACSALRSIRGMAATLTPPDHASCATAMQVHSQYFVDADGEERKPWTHLALADSDDAKTILRAPSPQG